jgi:2,3-bisphosphoglycerate-independent phosphoglycerate mutase
MPIETPFRPFVLVVLDGWGISNTTQGNPIREAKLPTFDKFNRYYPMTTLQASGISIGLPWNTAGNSEVGHMTMGAGRIIYQNMPRIALAIQDGSFNQNPVFLEAVERIKAHDSTLHLMGLISPGSVHSHKDHVLALLHTLGSDAGELPPAGYTKEALDHALADRTGLVVRINRGITTSGL